MNKYIFVLWLLVCIGCKSNTDSAKTISKQLVSERLPLAVVDSLVLLAEKMSDTEYTLTYLAAAEQLFLYHFDSVTSNVAASYIQKAELRAPISMKVNVSMTYLNWILSTIQITEKAKRAELLPIASQLIHQLDKRRMSNQQQIDYLLLKGRIYTLFSRFDKALEVVNKAKNIAKKEKFTEQMFRSIEKECSILATLGDTLNEQILQLQLANFNSNQINKTRCYFRLYYLENQKGNYSEALKWYHSYQNSLKPTAKNNIASLLQLANLYMKSDSFPQALEMLKIARQHCKTPIQNGNVDYQTAKVYLALQDTAKYEKHLASYIRVFQENTNTAMKKNTTTSIAAVCEYAKLLWEKKQHQQAIKELEKIVPHTKLLLYNEINRTPTRSSTFLLKRFASLKQLSEYYGETKRYREAFLLQQSYDTLSSILYENAKTDKYLRISRKYQNQELYSQLDLQLQRLRTRTILLQALIVLLVGMIICFISLYLSHRQRKKQLDMLYSKQKEIEYLQNIYTSKKPAEKIPADKQLFYDIEQCIRDNELFRQVDFSRDELCKRMGKNRMYISSSINKYAEMNFNQWINKARVQYAIELIHAGEHRLSELSRSSGFASSTSFFRNFKHFTSLSPNQYIEREKKDTSCARHKHPECSEVSTTTAESN